VRTSILASRLLTAAATQVPIRRRCATHSCRINKRSVARKAGRALLVAKHVRRRDGSDQPSGVRARLVNCRLPSGFAPPEPMAATPALRRGGDTGVMVAGAAPAVKKETSKAAESTHGRAGGRGTPAHTRHAGPFPAGDPGGRGSAGASPSRTRASPSRTEARPSPSRSEDGGMAGSTEGRAAADGLQIGVQAFVRGRTLRDLD